MVVLPISEVQAQVRIRKIFQESELSELTGNARKRGTTWNMPEKSVSFTFDYYGGASGDYPLTVTNVTASNAVR